MWLLYETENWYDIERQRQDYYNINNKEANIQTDLLEA